MSSSTPDKHSRPKSALGLRSLIDSFNSLNRPSTSMAKNSPFHSLPTSRSRIPQPSPRTRLPNLTNPPTLAQERRDRIKPELPPRPQPLHYTPLKNEAPPVHPYSRRSAESRGKGEGKWKNVEAEWRRQAYSLKIAHKNCLLGAECINILDPISDQSRFRSFARRQTPIQQSFRFTTPPYSPPAFMKTVCSDRSLDTGERLFPPRACTVRARQMMDRPRPCKRRARAVDQRKSPSAYRSENQTREIPLRRRSRSLPLTVITPSLPSPEILSPDPSYSTCEVAHTPSNLISADECGTLNSKEDTPRAWVMVSPHRSLSRSPSIPSENAMRQRRKRLDRLEAAFGF